MGIKRRYSYVFWVVLVGGCSFEASCGGKKLDVDKGEKLIADKLKEATGMTAVVTCPDNVKLAKDVVTDCDVKLGDLAGKARVTQTDDKGNVRWEMTDGFLVAAKAEDFLKAELSKSGGTDVAVDCGERVRVSEPGMTFRCKATPADARPPFEVELTIKDKQGTFDAKVIQ